jgi:hypothetical protein
VTERLSLRIKQSLAGGGKIIQLDLVVAVLFVSLLLFLLLILLFFFL